MRRKQIFTTLNRRENYWWELHSTSTILASFASSLRWLILDIFSAKLMQRTLFITDKKSFQNVWTTKYLGPAWYTHSNTCFQFLNNITCISTHFFTYTYFYTCFQTTKHMFLNTCTKYPLIFCWIVGSIYIC